MSADGDRAATRMGCVWGEGSRMKRSPYSFFLTPSVPLDFQSKRGPEVVSVWLALLSNHGLPWWPRIQVPTKAGPAQLLRCGLACASPAGGQGIQWYFETQGN